MESYITPFSPTGLDYSLIWYKEQALIAQLCHEFNYYEVMTKDFRLVKIVFMHKYLISYNVMYQALEKFFSVAYYNNTFINTHRNHNLDFVKFLVEKQFATVTYEEHPYYKRKPKDHHVDEYRFINETNVKLWNMLVQKNNDDRLIMEADLC